MNKNLSIILLIVLIIPVSINALNIENVQLFHNAYPEGIDRLFYANNQLMYLNASSVNVIFLNISTGQYITSNNYGTALVKYMIYEYPNNSYIATKYSGSVGTINLNSHNSSFGITSDINITSGYATNNAKQYWKYILGYYEYSATPINSFSIKDIRNGTIIYNNADRFGYFSSLLSLSSECGQNDNYLSPIGYDYDNDRLYLTCQNASHNLFKGLIYMKNDFYDNPAFYDNTEININDLEDYMNMTIISGINTYSQIRFIIVNDEIFMINKSNTSQILTGQYIDVYTGLVCDSVNCYDDDALCFPNNELYEGVNSSNYICSNVSITGDSPVCYTGTGLIEGGLLFCSGGCVNTELINPFGIEYLTGICYNLTSCTNDCSIEGLTYSDTSTSYKVCGAYDSDACLDWSSSIPCSDGEYSLNGFCEALNTTGNTYYNLDSFTATPQLDISSSYNSYSNPPRANYNSNENSLILGIDYTFTPTSAYITKTCDYKTTNVYNQPQHNINDSESFIIPLFTNGEVNIKFIDESLRMYGYDSSNVLMFDYNVSYNDTHGVCLYGNNTLLGCNSVVYGDIADITLTIKTNRPNTKQLNSARVIINKVNGAKEYIFTGFKLPLQDTSGTLYNVSLSGTGLIYYNNVNNEVQPSEAWKNTTWTQYNEEGETIYQHKCIYSSVGCKTIRSYYTEDLSNGYWNYKDYEVCINSLNNQLLNDESGIFNKLKPRDQILLSLGITIFLTLVFLVIGASMSNETAQKSLSIIGTAIFVSGLLFFSVIGWLPAWITILIIVIAGLIGMSLFLKQTNN